MRNANVLKGAKRLTAVLLALVMILGLVPQAFAAGQARSTETQTSSPEETVYVNSYGGSTREVDFSDHWRFNLGNGSAAKEYNDSAWRDVDLPHDYSIEQEYSASNEAESGYLPGGTGWYRKTFTLSPEWKGKYITIDFGGVYMNATVYLNGEELGFHPYGYTAFSFELPQEKLNFEGENVIAVEVEHQTPSSRWYSGSGIYRTVHLTVTDPVHVAKDGVYVTTPNLKNDRTDGTMNIKTVVENTSAVASEVTVRQTLYKQGSTAAAVAGFKVETSKSVPAGERITVEQTGKIENPALWSPDSPVLYTLKTEVLVGDSVVDTCETEFGFRWTNFNSTNGFELNGEPTKLKGVCMHHDQGSLGSEAWYRAIERQVEILKEMGCNAIRVTHNPAAPELIEIANEKGIMLIDEAFDTWTNPKNGNTHDYSQWFNVVIGNDNAILGGEADMTWAEFDIKAMVNQDKNSPAVIMYSLGNEVLEGISGNADNYPKIASDLIDWINEIDNTRPPTFGDNKLKSGNTTAAQVAQVIANNHGIVGYNYSTIGNLDSGTANGWLVYHSETASAVNSRGIYDRKASNGDGGKGDYLLTSYDKSAVGWGAVASDAWWRTITDDNSTGEFVWTGFDYIGEPTPWNGTGSGAIGTWPNSPKSSYFGIIDTNGLPKDTYYFYQSQWNDDVHTLHILPTWNEDEIVLDSSGNVEVVVYSDAAKVELYLNDNDTPIATATSALKTTAAGYTYRMWQGGTNHTNLYATFSVPYERGTLRAVAYDDQGQVISDTKGRSSVTTTTAATQLSLEADRNTITADGDDLSYITVSVKDAAGRLVNTDDVSVKLSITGNGVILGVDNGRQSDHASYQSLTRNTGAGQLVAVVQSTDDAGSFTVTATADGLVNGSVTVNTTAPADGGQVEEDAIVSYQISRNHYVKLGSTPELPKTVFVTYRNGGTETKNVNWNSYDSALTEKVGSFLVTGTIDGTTTTVSVSITMLDTVAALLNYSTAVKKDSTVNLPGSRPAVLEDGTILNAEFPVTWNIPEDLTETIGVKMVEGTSSVFGTSLEVTAFVRVAEGTVSLGSNVASSALYLTQSVPEEAQSDSLEAIIDGSIDYKAGPGQDSSGNTQPNPNVWTNYDWSQDAEANDNSYINFEYATAQNLGCVELYFFTDSWATAMPASATFQWNLSTDENGWQELSVEASEPEQVATTPAPVYKVVYTFDPVPAVQLRINLTNKEGGPSGTNRQYCVGLTEAKLILAIESFPISDSADLTGLTVNGQVVDANSLANYRYDTEALVIAENGLQVTSGNNAAYTVLPAHNDVVRILTESEDHSTRAAYEIHLGAEASAGDPADSSRDYSGDVTASAGSANVRTGSEGPVELALDGDASTHWHSNYTQGSGTGPIDLSNKPESRWFMLTLDEVVTLDALRYLPRSGSNNGKIKEYRVEVSTTGEDDSWTEVSTGTWNNGSDWQLAVFNAPVQAKYVRLWGVSTYGDVANKFMSAAEIRVRLAKETTDLSEAEVVFTDTTHNYKGTEICPKPDSVTLNGNVLRYGIDYVVEYENNIEPGKATMIVRGILDYSGNVTKTFTINEVPLTAVSYESVAVTTYVGVAPTLPGKVKAKMDIGPDKELNVTWDAIDSSQYAAAGTFTVSGTVEGQNLKPTATVTVLGAVAVEGTSTATVTGETPALPTTLTVYFNDGTTDEFPVTWNLEGVSFETAGEIVQVTGTVDLGSGKTMKASASVRVAEGTATDNIALKQSGSTLPLAVSFYAPESDTAANINDGKKTFDISSAKKVWSDWERDTYHQAPWVGIILGNGTTPVETLVNKISIGFIDEVASNNPEVQSDHAVRMPEKYVVQYYTGTVESLDYNASSVNNGRNWTNMGNDANWETVTVISQDAIPSSAEYAQMLDVTFDAVKTAAIRVVMTPQTEQWVGVDELEVYGIALTKNNDFTVSAITVDGEKVLDQFDEEKHITVTIEKGASLPEITATATDNASVTVIPAMDATGTSKIVFVSEDGSKTETYTISYEETDPAPSEWMVTFISNGETYRNITVVDGQAVSKPEDPARSGYIFTGWYTDESCTRMYDFNARVTSSFNLYAGWQKDEVPGATEWTVTFMSNGTTYQTLTVENDQSVSKPSNPTRWGYTFTGWYLDNACTIPYRFDTAVTSNLTLYAGWKRNTTEHKPVTPVDPIQPVEPEVPTFTDVKPTDWYSEAVAYTVEAGLMNGTGGGKFSPQATTTRGMLMTVLARMDGVDTTGGTDWYTKGMEWAKREGVSDGTNPELPITREQLAAMLYRYAGSPAVGSYTLNFKDADQVSDWALDAMRWAVKNGVVSGKGNQTLDPTGYATRAEVAQMLYNFSKVI